MAAGLSAALLAACSSGAPAAGTDPSAAPSGLVSSQLGTQVVDYLFSANAAEFRYGQSFALTMQTLVTVAAARCMTSHGFQETAAAPDAAQVTAETENLEDNTQFPDLSWIESHGLFVGGATTTSAPAGQPPQEPVAGSPAEEKAERADYSRCLQQAGSPEQQLNQASSALQQQWLDLLSAVEASAPMLAADSAFATCIERDGVPPADATNTTLFLAWETGQQSQASSQAATISVERHWVREFVPCAKSLLPLQIKLQQQKRAAFLQQHYQQIAAIEGTASQVMTALRTEAG